MSEQEKQEGQKTVVAFIAGLLIGGLLVWVFSTGENTEMPETEVSDEAAETTETDASDTTSSETRTIERTETTPETPVATLPTGDGSITVADQEAGSVIAIASAEFPTTDGWVAVRDYEGDMIGGILGAARYSESQGLVPTEIELLRGTEAGKSYAVVFFTEDGATNVDGKLYFDPAGDQQIEGIMTTFSAK